ncbi:MAG: M14 family zinc carboxypeptidase, partial [Oscillospiraceae bacterium]
WSTAREIKFAAGYTRPGPRDYVGPAPLTAPESLAMYGFTRALDPQLTLSYHTQGRVIYWQYDGYDVPGSKAIAERFAAASGYDVAETPYASGHAGYKDWFIQDFRRPGFTIEAGSGENPLPLSQFPDIWSDNLGILLGGMAAVL